MKKFQNESLLIVISFDVNNIGVKLLEKVVFYIEFQN